MDMSKPISITLDYFNGEKPDATAIRFIETALDTFLPDDEQSKLRVLTYIQQKTYEQQLAKNTQPNILGAGIAQEAGN